MIRITINSERLSLARKCVRPDALALAGKLNSEDITTREGTHE